MKELLQVKLVKKRKNPRFVRDESFKRKEVGPSWRKPRGQCSKVRRCLAGQPAMVNVGYRTPAQVRGLLRSGLAPIRVNNVRDVGALDKKKHAAVISASLDARKKLVVLDALQKAGVSIVNCDPKAFTDEVKRRQEEKKAARKKVAEVKEEPTKKKAAKKQAEQPAQEDKEKEKKELDKILTKKE